MKASIETHLVTADESGAEFFCTPLVMDIFEKRKIFFGINQSYQFSGTERIRFDCSVAIEPYSFFPSPHLWNMGAFSYSFSVLPGAPTITSKFKVGRYNSIAHECNVFHYRHPTHWVSSNPLLYSNRCIKFADEVRKDFSYADYEGAAEYIDDPVLTVIENDVWIGQRVQLSRRIAVGTGAVIGTGAVVTKNVDPYMIVGGVPAKVLRPRFNQKIIERLLQSRWWEYSPDIFDLCDRGDPEKFLDKFEELKQTNAIAPYMPEKITFKHIMDDLKRRLDSERDN